MAVVVRVMVALVWTGVRPWAGCVRTSTYSYSHSHRSSIWQLMVVRLPNAASSSAAKWQA